MFSLQRFYTAASLVALALLSACGGGGGSSSTSTSGYPQSPASCDTAGHRAWLRDYMNDQYFWYDRQAAPNNSASSIDTYFDSLLYKPTDRYSFSQSTSSFTQFFAEGKRTGYGYSLTSPASGTLVVRYTEPLSPVGLAGMKRGDNIISIDGLSASMILTIGLPAVSTAGVPRSFVVSDSLGTRSFTATSAEYTLSPVLDARVLTASNGRKAGYLAYNEFISTSSSALASAFDSFRTAGVQEMILDLRYNGGGSTTVSERLSTLIGGTRLFGSVFAQYRYNNKNSDRDVTQLFSSSSYTTPLTGLTRVFVITSESTASASEMVINNLRPYLQVITVGRTTFGKPYAFQPRDACGTTFNAVNIQISNAAGFGDYASGISPTCPAADDLTRQWGDPLENRTSAALSYISTGSCPPASNLMQNPAAAHVGRAQAAMNNVADGGALGEDGKPAPAPRGVMLQP